MLSVIPITLHYSTHPLIQLSWYCTVLSEFSLFPSRVFLKDSDANRGGYHALRLDWDRLLSDVGLHFLLSYPEALTYLQR